MIHLFDHSGWGCGTTAVRKVGVNLISGRLS